MPRPLYLMQQSFQSFSKGRIANEKSLRRNLLKLLVSYAHGNPEIDLS